MNGSTLLSRQPSHPPLHPRRYQHRLAQSIVVQEVLPMEVQLGPSVDKDPLLRIQRRMRILLCIRFTKGSVIVTLAQQSSMLAPSKRPPLPPILTPLLPLLPPTQASMGTPMAPLPRTPWMTRAHSSHPYFKNGWSSLRFGKLTFKLKITDVLY